MDAYQLGNQSLYGVCKCKGCLMVNSMMRRISTDTPYDKVKRIQYKRSDLEGQTMYKIRLMNTEGKRTVLKTVHKNVFKKVLHRTCVWLAQATPRHHTRITRKLRVYTFVVGRMVMKYKAAQARVKYRPGGEGATQAERSFQKALTTSKDEHALSHLPSGTSACDCSRTEER